MTWFAELQARWLTEIGIPPDVQVALYRFSPELDLLYGVVSAAPGSRCLYPLTRSYSHSLVHTFATCTAHTHTQSLTTARAATVCTAAHASCATIAP
jgi:hypothetical protein